MASTATSIPRFLLPQTGLLWQRFRVPNAVATGSIIIRYASTKSSKGEKPLILEKPARFNPPSHGARLPKKTTPRHYGGDLSAAEVQAQKVKEYPGLPAPEGTWSHWFWNSRALHLSITMGTLASLAIFTFVQNFKHTSPFADMVPSFSDFFSHPISSIRTVVEIIRLGEAHNSAIVAEKRKRRIDDVEKRNAYKKAHGEENKLLFGMFGTKTEEEMAAEKAEEARKAGADDASPVKLPPQAVLAPGEHQDAFGEVSKRKKVLGIF